MRIPRHNAEEIAQLRAALERAQQERDVLRGELRSVRTERDLLKERLNAFVRKLFAAKSEARGEHQQDFFLNEAELLGQSSAPAPQSPGEDDKVKVGAHARAKRGRKPLDPALPREVIRHELPEAERVCPHDGAQLTEIGVEVAEQLDIIPQQVRVIRHERVKYACPCCDQGLRVTPAPVRIIPKGLPSEAALAWNAEQPRSTSLKCLQAITRRHFQVVQPAGNLELPQLSARHLLDVRESPHADATS